MGGEKFLGLAGRQSQREQTANRQGKSLLFLEWFFVCLDPQSTRLGPVMWQEKAETRY